MKNHRRVVVTILIVAAIVSLLLVIAIAQTEKPKKPVKQPVPVVELTKEGACKILAYKCEKDQDANACGHWLAHCQR